MLNLKGHWGPQSLLGRNQSLMRTTRRTGTVALAITAVAAAAVLAACSSADTAAPASASAGSSMAAEQSAGGDSAQAGSESDITFAQLMIPHHEQAVQMADMALQKATTPEVQQLAQQIKDAQDPEIQQMRGWLTAWGAPEQMAGMDGMDHGDMDMGGQTAAGMMTDQDMSALMDASGTDFDQMWLAMMIAHHKGAIEMAQTAKADTTNPDVTALADAIVAAQTSEIDTMEKLLNQ